MLLRELMESVLNSQSAIDQLISNANQMYGLYVDILPDRIQNLYARGEHEDMLKTAKSVVGRAKGKWFADTYLSTSTRRIQPIAGLKNAMLTLSKDPKYNVEGLASMGSFVIMTNKERQKEVAGSGADYVTMLETLPDVMFKLASRTHDSIGDRLNISATRLKNAVERFYKMWTRLQDQWDADWGDNTPTKTDQTKLAKKAEQSAVGSQNSQIEILISQVLGSLDRKVAAEIRPIIAKSDNKLMTLQHELHKRNINM